ncbi:MAG: OmpA family protein [Flavobacteriaceae bacterium]|jgi:OOP family OmpA-OmpF porin|nr:OmpA family protein [Flavobacteriaceae bacterium]
MNKMNKKFIILFILAVVCIPASTWAQNIDRSDFSEDYVKFTNDQKQFNDWSVSVYAGLPWLQSADLTSIPNGMSEEWLIGYDFQLGINKQITHAFGLTLLGQIGKTKQAYGKNHLKGHTNYYGISLLGDLNVTSLFRRVDNRSEYRWGLHVYAGVGTLAYKAYSNTLGYLSPSYYDPKEEILNTDQKLKPLESFFGQVGTGLVFKVNNRIDLELKAMYVLTGDEAFDGSGRESAFNPFASLHPGSHTDNFITTSIGLTYKFGKHQEHLRWVDPLRELFGQQGDCSCEQQEFVVCKLGDQDDDGVCDDWDRELDTPKGARVDGSGRALDTDMDGVIDLYDACPTFPGPRTDDPKTNGCPVKIDIERELNEGLYDRFKGIEFDLNKAIIRPQSAPFLDNAADVIKKYGEGRKFIVEGHTDSRGNDAYNLKLSQQRVEAVVKYLEGKGIESGQLIPVGKGWEGAKWPECKPATVCPEYKNEQNRRVVFKLIDASGQALESTHDATKVEAPQ